MLDGETNLKQKSTLDFFQRHSAFNLCKLQGVVSCDAPNDLLYRFEGQFLQQKFSTQRAN
jgi:hypothetical protein